MPLPDSAVLALIPWFKLEPLRIPLPLIGSLPIQPFGVLAAIAILFGSYVAERRAAQVGVPREAVADFIRWVVPIGLVSCMILNVLFYEPDKLGEMRQAIASWFSAGPRHPFPYPGLSSFGGFFGGTLAALWYRQTRRASLLVLADIICFALPFAWVFARSGCFVVHDHPGAVSDFFLAVDNYNGELSPRHDLGLYEVIWSAFMIPMLIWLGKTPRPTGFFIAFVTLAYAPVRFLLDFLRETPEHGGDVRWLGLTPGHYASLAMLAIGVVVAIRVARAPRRLPLQLDAAS
jgi:phosphatidylglycerol:prolipoprotein diacylglycerol transferase